MPRSRSIAIQSERVERRSRLALTWPARLMAPPNNKSFSVSVVLPASGCEMIAKVRRRSTSAASGVCGAESAGSGMCIRRMWQRTPSGSRAAQGLRRGRLIRQREQADVALEQRAVAGDLQCAGLFQLRQRHAAIDGAGERLLIALHDDVALGRLPPADGQAALGERREELLLAEA